MRTLVQKILLCTIPFCTNRKSSSPSTLGDTRRTPLPAMTMEPQTPTPVKVTRVPMRLMGFPHINSAFTATPSLRLLLTTRAPTRAPRSVTQTARSLAFPHRVLTTALNPVQMLAAVLQHPQNGCSHGQTRSTPRKRRVWRHHA